MRKGCRRQRREAVAPVCVAMYLAPEVEITERMAIQMLLSGTAEPIHFDRLLDVADMLLLAATERRDNDVVEIAHMARIALANIADRYRAKGRLGMTGDEAKALEVLVDINTDWWSRQSGALFVSADRALTKFRKFQRAA